MQLISSGALVVMVAFASTARAEDDKNLQFAIRGGLATHVAGAADNMGIGDVVSVSIEGGYRLSSRYVLGGYLQYGDGQVPRCSPLFTSCSGRVLKFGGEFLVYLLDHRWVAPWFGLGVGYADRRITATTPPSTVSGGVILNVGDISSRSHSFDVIPQAGVDMRLGRFVSAGPYAAFSPAGTNRLEGGVRASLAL